MQGVFAMASGWTNKGKMRLLETLRGVSLPANFNIALITSTPDADTDTMGDESEITAGNGYVTGGISLAKTTGVWDVMSESDASDYGEIQLADVVWTASGGNIPSGGSGARFAVVTDANSTVSLREIWFYLDLVSNRTVSDTQTLTLTNCAVRLSES